MADASEIREAIIASRQSPRDAQARVRVAKAWLALGKPNLARIWVLEAVELDPHASYEALLTEIARQLERETKEPTTAIVRMRDVPWTRETEEWGTEDLPPPMLEPPPHPVSMSLEVLPEVDVVKSVLIGLIIAAVFAAGMLVVTIARAHS